MSGSLISAFACASETNDLSLRAGHGFGFDPAGPPRLRRQGYWPTARAPMQMKQNKLTTTALGCHLRALPTPMPDAPARLGAPRSITPAAKRRCRWQVVRVRKQYVDRLRRMALPPTCDAGGGPTMHPVPILALPPACGADVDEPPELIFPTLQSLRACARRGRWRLPPGRQASEMAHVGCGRTRRRSSRCVCAGQLVDGPAAVAGGHGQDASQQGVQPGGRRQCAFFNSNSRTSCI